MLSAPQVGGLLRLACIWHVWVGCVQAVGFEGSGVAPKHCSPGLRELLTNVRAVRCQVRWEWRRWQTNSASREAWQRGERLRRPAHRRTR